MCNTRRPMADDTSIPQPRSLSQEIGGDGTPPGAAYGESFFGDDASGGRQNYATATATTTPTVTTSRKKAPPAAAAHTDTTTYIGMATNVVKGMVFGTSAKSLNQAARSRTDSARPHQTGPQNNNNSNSNSSSSSVRRSSRQRKPTYGSADSPYVVLDHHHGAAAAAASPAPAVVPSYQMIKGHEHQEGTYWEDGSINMYTIVWAATGALVTDHFLNLEAEHNIFLDPEEPHHVWFQKVSGPGATWETCGDRKEIRDRWMVVCPHLWDMINAQQANARNKTSNTPINVPAPVPAPVPAGSRTSGRKKTRTPRYKN